MTRRAAGERFESKVSTHPSLLQAVEVSMDFHVNGSALRVLDEVTFSAAPGEMVCIIGRSGCGKTTLLNVLAGFLRPSGGQVLLGHEPIRGPGPDRCVVFQEDSLFPWLTVRENIAFGLKGRGKTHHQIRHEVDRYLALVGLEVFSEYLPREISGGMKQRVALARVLILHPQVLLMDEPFASLDYHSRREMQALLVSLWRNMHQTVVFVTHDMDEAIVLADRVIVMDMHPGRVRAEVDVPLERPREPEETEYVFFRRRLYDLLKN